MNAKSLFEIHSIGYAAVNKKRDSWDIEVVLVNSSPFMDGELSDNVETTEAEGADADGKSAFNVSVDSTATVRARWMPFANTNRKTPPDIRRGEPVIVFKLADTDVYYWIEYLGRENLRRLETVVYSWGNEREENKNIDEKNSYWMVVSTHDKHIRLHTSNSDGEPFVYDLELNTKDGTFSFTDDTDNYFFVDSKKKLIRFQNADKSFVEMNKTDINMECKATISMKCKDYKLLASNSITTETKTNNNKATSYRMDAQTFTVYAKTSITGDVTIKGDTTHNGNTRTNGNAYEASSSGPNNTR